MRKTGSNKGKKNKSWNKLINWTLIIIIAVQQERKRKHNRTGNMKKNNKKRNKNKNKTYKQTNNAMYIQPEEVSSPADLPIVPRTAAAFPCCTVTEIRWRRYSSDLGSPVTCLRCRLRSWMKERASGPNTPEVSTATGIRWWLESRLAYLETKHTSKQILIWYLHMCNPNLSALSNQFTA